MEVSKELQQKIDTALRAIQMGGERGGTPVRHAVGRAI